MKRYLTRKNKASDKNFFISCNCKKLWAKQHVIREKSIIAAQFQQKFVTKYRQIANMLNPNHYFEHFLLLILIKQTPIKNRADLYKKSQER